MYSMLNYRAEDAIENPCLGCTSMKCRTCACQGDTAIRDEIRGIQKMRSAIAAKERKEQIAKETIDSGHAQKTDRSRRKDNPFTSKGKTRLTLDAFFGKTKSFVLAASGDGMRNAGIWNGDYLLFAPDVAPKSGDIVAAVVDGENMCRRVFLEGERYRIRREDGVTPDLLTSDCVIYGVLIGLMRNCMDGKGAGL